MKSKQSATDSISIYIEKIIDLFEIKQDNYQIFDLKVLKKSILYKFKIN